MRYREVAARLSRLGCAELQRRGGGSHRTWHNPSTGKLATVPDWGAKDIKLGTLRSAVRQLGLDWKSFLDG